MPSFASYCQKDPLWEFQHLSGRLKLLFSSHICLLLAKYVRRSLHQASQKKRKKYLSIFFSYFRYTSKQLRFLFLFLLIRHILLFPLLLPCRQRLMEARNIPDKKKQKKSFFFRMIDYTTVHHRTAHYQNFRQSRKNSRC